MNAWIKRLSEYWNDKKLAEKCGMWGKEICNHEGDGYCYDKDKNYVLGYRLNDFHYLRCIKCGEFYR